MDMLEISSVITIIKLEKKKLKVWEHTHTIGLRLNSTSKSANKLKGTIFR